MTSSQTPAPASASAARALGAIGLIASAVVLGSTFTPGPGDDLAEVVGVRWVATATAVLAACLFLPVWRRLPLRATLVMVPPALAVVAVHNTVAGQDPYRYGVFFLLLFVWVGAHHPRWTSVRLAPLTAAAYVAPLLVHGTSGAAWTALYAVPVFVAVGEVIAARSGALVAAHDEMRRLAHTDPLTGLLDRRAFTAAADRARATGEGGLLLAFVDLDGFKPVNDALGHAAGDALLQRIAAWLVSDLRDGDLIGRLGGDEFAVMLRGTTAADEPGIVERIRLAVAEASPPAVLVGASVGLARLDDHPDVESALRAADAEMYTAKRSRPGTREASRQI